MDSLRAQLLGTRPHPGWWMPLLSPPRPSLLPLPLPPLLLLLLPLLLLPPPVLPDAAAAAGPALPQVGLLAAFEATDGVERDANGQVISWSCAPIVSGPAAAAAAAAAMARTNSSRHANRDQRRANAGRDATLLSDAHGLPSLARAHEADARGLADARPTFVSRGGGLAAVEFDGDDYMELPVAHQPREGGLTVLALLRLTEDRTVLPAGRPGADDAPRRKRQRPHTTRYWFGMGSPASSGDVQYSVSAIGAQIRLHVVPVAHDPKRPSVRNSARLRAASSFDQDTLISITLDGSRVRAWLDGNASAFTGQSEYGGPIDFDADYGVGMAKAFVGSGPSAPEHWLYTGEGARGTLSALVIYSRALDEVEVRAAEHYLACKHKHARYFPDGTFRAACSTGVATEPRLDREL